MWNHFKSRSGVICRLLVYNSKIISVMYSMLQFKNFFHIQVLPESNCARQSLCSSVQVRKGKHRGGKCLSKTTCLVRGRTGLTSKFVSISRLLFLTFLQTPGQSGPRVCSHEHTLRAQAALWSSKSRKLCKARKQERGRKEDGTAAITKAAAAMTVWPLTSDPSSLAQDSVSQEPTCQPPGHTGAGEKDMMTLSWWKILQVGRWSVRLENPKWQTFPQSLKLLPAPKLWWQIQWIPSVTSSHWKVFFLFSCNSSINLKRMQSEGESRVGDGVRELTSIRLGKKYAWSITSLVSDLVTELQQGLWMCHVGTW